MVGDIEVVSCRVCGAVVRLDETPLHVEWHNDDPEREFRDPAAVGPYGRGVYVDSSSGLVPVAGSPQSAAEQYRDIIARYEAELADAHQVVEAARMIFKGVKECDGCHDRLQTAIETFDGRWKL